MVRRDQATLVDRVRPGRRPARALSTGVHRRPRPDGPYCLRLDTARPVQAFRQRDITRELSMAELLAGRARPASSFIPRVPLAHYGMPAETFLSISVIATNRYQGPTIRAAPPASSTTQRHMMITMNAALQVTSGAGSHYSDSITIERQAGCGNPAICPWTSTTVYKHRWTPLELLLLGAAWFPSSCCCERHDSDDARSRREALTTLRRRARLVIARISSGVM
jgi:hypothetical protein